MNIGRDIVKHVAEQSVLNLKKTLREKKEIERQMEKRIETFFAESGKKVENIVIQWRRNNTCTIDFQIGV